MQNWSLPQVGNKLHLHLGKIPLNHLYGKEIHWNYYLFCIIYRVIHQLKGRERLRPCRIR